MSIEPASVLQIISNNSPHYMTSTDIAAALDCEVADVTFSLSALFKDGTIVRDKREDGSFHYGLDGVPDEPRLESSKALPKSKIPARGAPQNLKLGVTNQVLAVIARADKPLRASDIWKSLDGAFNPKQISAALTQLRHRKAITSTGNGPRTESSIVKATTTPAAPKTFADLKKAVEKIVTTNVAADATDRTPMTFRPHAVRLIEMPFDLDANTIRAIRINQATACADLREQNERIGWLLAAWDVIVQQQLKQIRT